MTITLTHSGTPALQRIFPSGLASARQDVSAEELASYCVHALAAAGNSSTTAIDRLLDLVWTGIASTRSTQSHVRHSASQPTE
jgi:hypothetical protein